MPKSASKIVAEVLKDIPPGTPLEEATTTCMKRLADMGRACKRKTVYTYVSKMRNHYPISSGVSYAVSDALRSDLSKKVAMAEALLIACDGSAEECLRIINGVKQLM